MVGTVSTVWELRLAEFNEVLEGTDGDLVEGYSTSTRINLNNALSFVKL